MKRLLGKNKFRGSLGIIIVLSLVLTACAGNANTAPNNTPTVTPNASPAETPVVTSEALTEDAKQTASAEFERKKVGDELVVYSAGPAGLANNILEGFQEKHGIQVEMFQGTTGAILARIEAEKANPIVDVVVLASYPSAAGIKTAGYTQAYPEALHADELHEGWTDEDYHFFGYSGSALGITYNTSLVDTVPADWSDLAKPEWRDFVNMPDPTLSGSALDFISGYISAHGEMGWQLFEDLYKNGVTVAGANSPALDPVITGAKSAVIAGVDYMAYSANVKGEPVEVIYPASGTVVNPRPAAILEWSKNVENARLFIDYLLSDEAQQLVTNAYIIPGRKDILADNRVNMKDILELDYDWAWMEENAEEVISRFTDIFRQ